MRTDWNLTVKVVYYRASTPGSLGAKDQYVVGFTTEVTKNVGFETRTTNVFVGVDSSGLYKNQDIYWTLEGPIYPNTKIANIVEGIDIISDQLLTIGISTTKIYGVNTIGITSQAKIIAKANIIAPNTSVISVGSTYVEIFPATLNTNLVVGIATTTLSFYEFNGEYSLELSARTTNSDTVENFDMNFGVGTVVGIGSTYLDNAIISYPSGVQVFRIGDFVVPNENIIGEGSTVTGYAVTGFIPNKGNVGKIYFSEPGINTRPIGVATVVFGYYGDAARVTTANDYGDILDVKFSSEETIGINTNIISNIDTSQIVVGQYLDPVTGVFDNELGTYVTDIDGDTITINVASSNTESKDILLRIGNIISQPSKRYIHTQYTTYTIESLTKFGSGIIVDNDSAFPAYGNPPGSSNGDPSLRYIYGLPPTDWDINKVLGVKDYPTDHNRTEFKDLKGRRTYSGPLYPRHVFGR
jgi:hypothetical protein